MIPILKFSVEVGGHKARDEAAGLQPNSDGGSFSFSGAEVNPLGKPDHPRPQRTGRGLDGRRVE